MGTRIFVIFIFTFFFAPVSWASTAIKIFYNTNDCIACINLLPLFKQLDPRIEKIMIVTESTKPIMQELLQNHDFRDTDFKWDYVSDDYFVRKASGKTLLYPSYCLVFEDGVKRDSFLLKYLPVNISRINVKILPDKDKTYRIKIPDSLSFSQRINFRFNGNSINISDNVLNKNVLMLFNSDRSAVSKVVVVKGKDFHAKNFLAANCFDTVTYNKCRRTIKAAGYDVPSIQAAYVTDTSLHLLISLYYPRVSGKDTLLFSKPFLYSRSLASSGERMSCLSPDGVLEPMQGKYVLIPDMPFLIKGNKAFFSVSNYNASLEKEFLSEFDLSTPTPSFVGIQTNTAGAFRYEKRSQGYMLNKRITTNYYFTPEYPYFFDFINNKQFKLNPDDFVHNYHRDYFIEDIIKDKNDLYLLVSFGKTLIRYKFDSENRQVAKETLNIDEDLRVDHIRFVTPNSYVLLDNRDLVFINHR